MALSQSQQLICAMLFGATVSGIGTQAVVKKRAAAPKSEASIITPAEPSRTVKLPYGGSITIFDSPILGVGVCPPPLTDTFKIPESQQERPPVFPTINGEGNFQQIVTRVPEPDTWMMLIAGFGFVGLSLRKSKRKVSQ